MSHPVARRLPLAVVIVGIAMAWPATAAIAASPPHTSAPLQATVTSAVGSWTKLPSPPSGYGFGSRITRLKDGRILLANGGKDPVVFDPTDGSWTATPSLEAFHLAFPDGPTLVTLADGKVLMGGYFLFDPDAWTWTRVQGSASGNAALALPDGRVLFFGSGDNFLPPVTCRKYLSIYDPATDTSSNLFGDGSICLSAPLMAQLPDGRVLIHGGCPTSVNDSGAGTGGTWFVDPVAKTFSQADPLATAAGICSGGALLADGAYLVAGYKVFGGYPYNPIWKPDAVRFDVTDATATATTPLPASMTVLRSIVAVDRRALVVAGDGASGIVPTTRLFDPVTNAWTTLTPWPGNTVQDTTTLADGSVFVVDGSGDAWNLVVPPPPPIAHIAPVATMLAATSLTIAWSGTPGPAALASYDVRYRRAPWNGSFGSLATWRSATTSTSATFSGLPGSTYCFSSRARDENGTESAWTSETCTGIALDDRSLSVSGSWASGTNASDYRGTYRRSSSNGASLVRTGVVARRLGIVVTTCSTCGYVRVYWGSTLLKTISLKSTTTMHRRLMSLTPFTSVRTGTVTLRVYGNTHNVIIDGLAIRGT